MQVTRRFARGGTLAGLVVLALLAGRGTSRADGLPLDPDAARDLRAWAAGQLLAQRVGLPAVPLAFPEERGGVQVADAVARTLGVALPTPGPEARADVGTRTRWLLAGDGRRAVEAIGARFGERAGALASLATVLPLLAVAWPDAPKPAGFDLMATLHRDVPPALLPSRLLRPTYDLQARRPDARVVAAATQDTMRGVVEHLYFEAIGPTAADVRAVAWDWGRLLGTLEYAALDAPIGAEDRARVVALCARVGVEPPRLPTARVQGDAAVRAHLQALRFEYADAAYARITTRHGEDVADLSRLGWRLAVPGFFDLGRRSPNEERARQLEAVAARVALAPGTFTALVQAIRTGQPPAVLEARAAETAKAVAGQLEEGVMGRASVPPRPAFQDPAACRLALFRTGGSLSRGVLGIARRPDLRDAWIHLKAAVDHADAVGLSIVRIPARRGDADADVEAAAAYLRRTGPVEALAARVERQAGPVGRAYFDLGRWVGMLRQLYEPGTERTRPLVAAVEAAWALDASKTDAWGAALAAAKAGAPKADVARELERAEDRFLGNPPLLLDDSDEDD